MDGAAAQRAREGGGEQAGAGAAAAVDEPEVEQALSEAVAAAGVAPVPW